MTVFYFEKHKAGFEIDGNGHFRFSEQLLDYVLLIPELFPTQYSDFIK